MFSTSCFCSMSGVEDNLSLRTARHWRGAKARISKIGAAPKPQAPVLLRSVVRGLLRESI
eukprot:10359111-Alexandrium_andersonii.AAC.1